MTTTIMMTLVMRCIMLFQLRMHLDLFISFPSLDNYGGEVRGDGSGSSWSEAVTWLDAIPVKSSACRHFLNCPWFYAVYTSLKWRSHLRAETGVLCLGWGQEAQCTSQAVRMEQWSSAGFSKCSAVHSLFGNRCSGKKSRVCSFKASPIFYTLDSCTEILFSSHSRWWYQYIVDHCGVASWMASVHKL